MPNVTIDLIRVLGVPLLVGMNGFFVAAEFAIIKVRWTRVEELVEEGRFGALAVRQVVERLDDTIASTQLGITFASLGLGWLGEPALEHLIEPWLVGLSVPWNVAVSHIIATALSFLAITYMHVVLGELVPKALALERAEQLALFVAGPLLFFGRVFRPFIRFMKGSGRWVVKVLRLPPVPDAQKPDSTCWLQMLLATQFVPLVSIAPPPASTISRLVIGWLVSPRTFAAADSAPSFFSFGGLAFLATAFAVGLVLAGAAFLALVAVAGGVATGASGVAVGSVVFVFIAMLHLVVQSLETSIRTTGQLPRGREHIKRC
jgi:hypothetical protein